VRGVDPTGKLSVRWHDDDGEAQSCSFYYELPPPSKDKSAKALQQITATCTRSNAVAQVSRSGS
jgi:outer membrane usher protein